MRRVKSILSVSLATLLLAATVCGCGGGKDTSSTASGTASNASGTSSNSSTSSKADSSSNPGSDASANSSTDPNSNTGTNSTPNSNPGSNTSSNTTPEPPKPMERKLYDDKVENMGGYEFVIANPWMNREPPDNAGLAERLIHQRIDEVEKEYNCKVRITDFYGGMEALMPRIMAGDKVADVLNMLPEMWIPAAGAGFLRTWNDVADIVNFYDTRWLEAQTNATLKGKTYILQYERPADSAALFLWYNKDVLKAAGIKEDPAQMALDGTWTWDVFREMLKKINKPTANRYGLHWVDSYSSPLRALAASNGAMAVTMNSKNEYVATFSDQKYIDALNFLDQIVNVDKTMKIYPNMKTEEKWNDMPSVETVFNNFEKGLAGFIAGRIWYGGSLKLKEGLNYGMVVYPKGPAAKDYISCSNTLGGFAMTSTNPDYEKAAKIFRAIARPTKDFEDIDAYENDIVSDFFMDGDEMSKKMMRLGAKNSVLDVGYSVRNLQMGLDRAGISAIFWQENTVAASIDAIKGTFDKDIQDTFKKLP